MRIRRAIQIKDSGERKVRSVSGVKEIRVDTVNNWSVLLTTKMDVSPIFTKCGLICMTLHQS